MNQLTNSPITTIRVSGILIEEGKLLLLKHHKAGRSYWVLPGGHLEFGETLPACIEREMREETGLETSCERFLYFSESIDPSGRRHIINFFALLKRLGGEASLCETDGIIEELAFHELSDPDRLSFYPNIKETLIADWRLGFPEIGVSYIKTPWV